jgi:hypothetical protein
MQSATAYISAIPSDATGYVHNHILFYLPHLTYGSNCGCAGCHRSAETQMWPEARPTLRIRLMSGPASAISSSSKYCRQSHTDATFRVGDDS